MNVTTTARHKGHYWTKKDPHIWLIAKKGLSIDDVGLSRELVIKLAVSLRKRWEGYRRTSWSQELKNNSRAKPGIWRSDRHENNMKGKKTPRDP